VVAFAQHTTKAARRFRNPLLMGEQVANAGAGNLVTVAGADGGADANSQRASVRAL